MSLKGILKFALASVILVIAGRFSFLEFQTWKEKNNTANLCFAVGNYLETGSIRDAYENLQSGLLRVGYKNACVSVIENGKNFSTNCADPNISYNTTVCRAETNASVYAQVLYPQERFFDLVFWQSLMTVFLVCLGLSFIAQFIISSLAREVTEELQHRILNTSPQRSFFSKFISNVLEKTGVIEVIQKQTKKFENDFYEFEEKRKKSARQQARMEAEAEKNKSYIQMVKQIRHDIRSPLSSLMAIRSEINADKEIAAALSYSIASIEKMIERLGNSTGSEKTRLAIIEVLVEEVAASLAVKFSKGKNVLIDVFYDSKNLSAAQLAPFEFQRVIENLLENAFDAVSSNGKIHIKILKNESTCSIQIDDNGCGVPIENRENLFSDGATFQKVGGSGKGLVFVKEQLQAWNGKVSYAPLNQGSRFEIVLPLLQTGASYVGRLEPSKVVIVDDDESFPVIMQKNGFDIMDVAASYDEGLKMLESKSSEDVSVLIDEDLGFGLRGSDLIRRSGASGHTYICTNDYDDPELVRRAKALGVKILPKPLFRMVNLAARSGA